MADPIETTPGVVLPVVEQDAPFTGAQPRTVAVTPTQVRRPWRATARTAFQALVALAVLFPILVEQTGLDADDLPWLAVPLGVAAFIARVMALPQVEVFLRQFLPFLAATPKE